MSTPPRPTAAQPVLLFAARFLICCVVVAIGLGLFVALTATRPTPAENPAADEVRRVLVVEALERPVGRRWTVYGTAQPIDSADVPAQVSAMVESIAPNFREGEEVARDEILVQLDRSDFERQLEIAEQTIASIDAQLALLAIDEKTAEKSVELVATEAELAHADVVRAEGALREGAAVDREVDRLRALALVADRALIAAREARDKIPARRRALEAERLRQKSSRDLAKANLERCTIRSPLAGVLEVADLEVGEMAQPGMRIARVVCLEAVEVPLLVPASARPHLRVGCPVFFDDGGGGPPLEASIVRIAPTDDPLTRTTTVFAELDRDAAGESRIAPGSFVKAQVLADQEAMRSVLPRRAVSEGRVLVVDGGRIRAQQVDVEFTRSGTLEDSGLPDTEWAVLREPLPAGTLVVLDGSRQIPDGTAVVATRVADDVHADGKDGRQR